MSQDRFLLLDACSLINLAPSGIRLSEIASVNDCEFVVTAIAAEESLFIAGRSSAEPSIPVSVADLAAPGELSVTELTPNELRHFVSLVKSVDDGEASTLAVASERNVRMATDDRRAIRVASEIGVTVLTTSQLLRGWAEGSAATSAEVAATLLNVERRGNFSPRRDDPERAWWTASLRAET